MKKNQKFPKISDDQKVIEKSDFLKILKIDEKKKLFRKSGSITFLYHPKSALDAWLRAD